MYFEQVWHTCAFPLREAPARFGHARVGNRFRRLAGDEHVSTGTFLELDPPRRVRMSWRWTEGGADPGESELSFDLRPIAEGTELTLTHAKLQDDEAARSHSGVWSGALDKLVAAMERTTGV